MQVVKDFTFDAAHRLVRGYQGKCSHLHGHTYKVAVTVAGPVLDHHCMLVDFDFIKASMKSWVDLQLDHATLVSDEDTELLSWLRQHDQKYYPVSGNPTAEKLAHMLHSVFTKVLPRETDLHIASVQVWETPTSSAVYCGE